MSLLSVNAVRRWMPFSHIELGAVPFPFFNLTKLLFDLPSIVEQLVGLLQEKPLVHRLVNSNGFEAMKWSHEVEQFQTRQLGAAIHCGANLWALRPQTHMASNANINAVFCLFSDALVTSSFLLLVSMHLFLVLVAMPLATNWIVHFSQLLNITIAHASAAVAPGSLAKQDRHCNRLLRRPAA